jgi:hypothetical protein
MARMTPINKYNCLRQRIQLATPAPPNGWGMNTNTHEKYNETKMIAAQPGLATNNTNGHEEYKLLLRNRVNHACPVRMAGNAHKWTRRIQWAKEVSTQFLLPAP